METQHTRTEMLLGDGSVERLSRMRVAVFGVGGVGGYAVEALARSGVGTIVLTDSDTVSLSNINRQIVATHKTLGRYKTEVARERILEINPEARVEVNNIFFSQDTRDSFDFSSYDYVIDAIDSLSAKIELIACAKEADVPIISAMGAGNKLDPTRFEVADISKTEVCPLARAVRVALRKRGIHHLKVVYSKELPMKDKTENTSCTERLGKDGRPERRSPGSVAFVPSVMGLIIAGEVIKDLIKQ